MTARTRCGLRAAENAAAHRPAGRRRALSGAPADRGLGLPPFSTAIRSCSAAPTPRTTRCLRLRSFRRAISFTARFSLRQPLLFRGGANGAWRSRSLPCLHHLYDTCPPLVPYVAVLVPTLYCLLGREDRPGPAASRRFWSALLVGVVLLPKCIQGACRTGPRLLARPEPEPVHGAVPALRLLFLRTPARPGAGGAVLGTRRLPAVHPADHGDAQPAALGNGASGGASARSRCGAGLRASAGRR